MYNQFIAVDGPITVVVRGIRSSASKGIPMMVAETGEVTLMLVVPGVTSAPCRLPPAASHRPKISLPRSRLNEPSVAKTYQLLKNVAEQILVVHKTIRPAWFEGLKQYSS